MLLRCFPTCRQLSVLIWLTTRYLLYRLSFCFGVTGKAVCWFLSYFEDRDQVVNVERSTSYSKDWQCGLPQRSLLGYLSVYTSPHGNIVKAHGLSCHLYAEYIALLRSDCSFKIRQLQYE